MIKIATLIYYIDVVIVSATLSFNDCHPNDITWWVVITGLIVARICGEEEGGK